MTAWRTLHIGYSSLPDPQGGTEIYVDALCRELQQLAVAATVIAPGRRHETYEVNGVRVRRFTGRPVLDVDDIYRGDRVAAESVARILDEESPDLVHQHALTPACSPLVAREVKRRGIPLVFTYHSATATCARGTLIEFDVGPCDGRLDVARCTECSLGARGAGRVPARLLAAVPPLGGDLLGKTEGSGKPWTAVRMSSLVRRQHAGLKQFLTDVDRFVVLTPWVKAVLRRNGVADSRMVRSDHGLSYAAPHVRRRDPQPRLRLAHLSRVDRLKGTDLLIKALRTAPDVAVDLDIYGIVQEDTDPRVLEELRALAEGDARIRFRPALDRNDLLDRLAEHDLVAVPSQSLETGPLVVLEAFAAGVPVLGSAIGGVADKVTDSVDGMLVDPFNDVEAWTAALRHCDNGRDWVAGLAERVRAPRTMNVVAHEMQTVYAELIALRSDRAANPAAPARPATFGSRRW